MHGRQVASGSVIVTLTQVSTEVYVRVVNYFFNRGLAIFTWLLLSPNLDSALGFIHRVSSGLKVDGGWAASHILIPLDGTINIIDGLEVILLLIMRRNELVFVGLEFPWGLLGTSKVHRQGSTVRFS
jgi:hypothetical protein